VIEAKERRMWLVAARFVRVLVAPNRKLVHIQPVESLAFVIVEPHSLRTRLVKSFDIVLFVLHKFETRAER
jgi:hypothetical protein